MTFSVGASLFGMVIRADFVANLLTNFHKGEVYLIEENFVGKTFLLENIFVTKPIFRHLLFPDEKFFSDMINIFDLK